MKKALLVISILFMAFCISAEALATFEAIYIHNKLKPEYLVLINPGMNIVAYSDFKNENSILAKTILNNLAGKPKFLIGS